MKCEDCRWFDPDSRYHADLFPMAGGYNPGVCVFKTGRLVASIVFSDSSIYDGYSPRRWLVSGTDDDDCVRWEQRHEQARE